MAKRNLPPGWTLLGVASDAAPQLPVLVAQSAEFSVWATAWRHGQPGFRRTDVYLSAHDRITKRDIELGSGRESVPNARGAVDKVIAVCEALKKARDVGAVPTPNASRSAERFTVRKMVSGRTGVAKFYVYDTVSKGRVTVHAHLLRDSAAAEADSLNIGDMVRPHAEDPRPYDERRAEAEESYMARRRRI